MVNTSPVIALSKVGAFDLLTRLSSQLVIPGGVVDEVYAGPPGDPAILAIRSVETVVRTAVEAIDSAVASWDLGRGESEVLSWAITHRSAEAILDDREARMAARTLGVPVRGTLGIVLLAKRRGLLAKARPMVEQIVGTGLRLDPVVIDDALRLVGE